MVNSVSTAVIAAMALTIVAVLTGCGSSSTTPATTAPGAAAAPPVTTPVADPADRVRATTHAYFLALANRDARAVCALMTSAKQEQLVRVTAVGGASTCAAALKLGFGSTGREELEPLRTDKIVVLSLHGGRAVARRVHGTDRIRLRHFSFGWLIDK